MTMSSKLKTNRAQIAPHMFAHTTSTIAVREANEDQQRVGKALLCMSARDILGDVGMLQAQITVLGPPDPID